MGKEELSAGGSSSEKAEEDAVKQPKTEIDGPGPESEQNGKVRVKKGKNKISARPIYFHIRGCLHERNSMPFRGTERRHAIVHAGTHGSENLPT